MRSVVALSTLLIIAFQGSPQDLPREVTISVKDSSPTGAPLRASGSALVSRKITAEGIESTTELQGALRNISSKPIMAYEATIDLSAGYSSGDRIISRVDFFFFENSLMPGATSDFNVPSHRSLLHWNQAKHSISRDEIDSQSNALADVKTTFVLFADGTSFGASQWGNNLTVQRETLTEIMRGLLRAFDEGKETSLKTAIEKELNTHGPASELYPSLNAIKEKFEAEGAVAAAQYLRSCLANAQHNSSATHSSGRAERDFASRCLCAASSGL